MFLTLTDLKTHRTDLSASAELLVSFLEAPETVCWLDPTDLDRRILR